MPQMTPAQARVIDPILSTVARGYQNGEMVGSALFPTVPVNQRGGKILSFGIEQFLEYDMARAPGANTKRMQVGYLGLPYVLNDYSLEGMVPVENAEEAAAVPGLSLASLTINSVRAIMALRLEKEQAVLATNAALYGAANKITLAGNDQWSAVDVASQPTLDIEVAKAAIRAKTGKRANLVIMGPLVMASLRNHATFIDRMKYTGRDSVDTRILQQMWDIERVVVGNAITSSSATVMTPVDVWGKFVVVAYTTPGSMASQGTPSYGYTYQLSGYPIVETPYHERNPKSWMYPVTDAVAPVIASADAGYLITGAVA